MLKSIAAEHLLTEGKVGTVTFVDGSTEQCKIFRTPVGPFIEVSEEANIKVVLKVEDFAKAEK